MKKRLQRTKRRTVPVPIAAPAGRGPLSSLAAGGAHACAADVDGDVWCWGDNEVYGQLGNG